MQLSDAGLFKQIGPLCGHQVLKGLVQKNYYYKYSVRNSSRKGNTELVFQTVKRDFSGKTQANVHSTKMSYKKHLTLEVSKIYNKDTRVKCS